MSEIEIRFYEERDASALYEAARESIGEVHPWLPWCHPDYTLQEAEEWIATHAEGRASGTHYQFAIVEREERFLGGCGLSEVNTVHRLANLGYWVRSSATGRGVAPAAVRALVDWAFRETEIIRLEIVAAVDNRRSQRVALKAGALREGVLRDRLVLHGRAHDAVMHSIVRSRWSPS
jgi:RimJ/RimL family protein N-acetyltransferase